MRASTRRHPESLRAEDASFRDNESVRWSIALAEVLGLVPLKMKFHTVTPYAGVFRFDGCVPEGGLETKQLVELNGRCDVADHQYWPPSSRLFERRVRPAYVHHAIGERREMNAHVGGLALAPDGAFEHAHVVAVEKAVDLAERDAPVPLTEPLRLGAAAAHRRRKRARSELVHAVELMPEDGEDDLAHEAAGETRQHQPAQPPDPLPPRHPSEHDPSHPRGQLHVLAQRIVVEGRVATIELGQARGR